MRSLRLFLRKLLPIQLRVYLAERDLQRLEEEAVAPYGSDVVWVDSPEELSVPAGTAHGHYRTN